MSVGILRDLRGLNVLVVHPTDSEGAFLVDHLRRIGCKVSAVWPAPSDLPAEADVVFLSIDDEDLSSTKELLKSIRQPAPTILAIASYENPATLQVILESGALIVIQRPLKPFGLLTNLAIARSIWLRHQHLTKELQKYKRRVLGDQKLLRAKTILMASMSLSESQAHEEIRRRAMQSRVPMEKVAEGIIEDEADLTQTKHRV